MGLAFGVWLAVLGILGASNLIIARKPDAKELIAKLAPYQGWIGAGAAISGLYYLIMGVLNIAMLGQGFAFLIAWIDSRFLVSQSRFCFACASRLAVIRARSCAVVATVSQF